MKKLLENSGRVHSVWKYDLKMKLSTIFLLVSVFAMQANSTYSQNTKVTLNVRNASIEQVIDLIEEKTEFRFAYKIKDVDIKRIVSIKANKEKITSILERIFLNTKTTYKIIDRQIFLTRKAVKTTNVQNVVGEASTQQSEVSGTVLDSDGTPLPGANILEKGTTNGTQTDFDGNFTLALSDPNATLEISYIGFATQDIAIDGQTTISITLRKMPQVWMKLL